MWRIHKFILCITLFTIYSLTLYNFSNNLVRPYIALTKVNTSLSSNEQNVPPQYNIQLIERSSITSMPNSTLQPNVSLILLILFNAIYYLIWSSPIQSNDERVNPLSNTCSFLVSFSRLLYQPDVARAWSQ
jgi:hypothetical protein